MANGIRVAVSVLGPLECRIGDRVVVVGSRKQRAILAVLALGAPEVVSSDRLISALWGEDAPASAKNSLEAHVSRLRKLFGERGAESVLSTRRPGYALEAETDLEQFEQRRASAAAKAAAGEIEPAAGELEGALELWRGEVLADLSDEPFAPLEMARLEERRLSAREELIGYQLELGKHRAVIPELESLVEEHPLREGLCESLMLALYRAGRQADALELYRKTEALLRHELGLEPSPRLRELQQAILRHDSALQPGDTSGKTATDRLPGPAPRERSWPSARWWLAAAAAVLAAVAAGALAFVFSGGSRGAAPTRPRPLGKHLLASISSPLPSCCAFGFGGVWIVGHHDETVAKIDPQRKKIVARYRIAGFQAEAPLAAAGSLWSPAAGQAKFVRFNPVRKRVVATYPTTAAEIAWGYNSIWATTRDHQLIRINLRTNKIASRLRLSAGFNDFDDGIAVGFGSIWITNTDNSTLLRIDPSSNRIVGSITGFGSTNSWMPVSTGDGSVWVYRITGDQGVVYRIDPYTNRIVKRIPVGFRNVAWPNGYMLDGGGYVWTCDAHNTMSQIDPRTNRVVGWYTVPETCQEVAYGDGSVWTALYDHSLVDRIDPAR
ncbi:MAG: BTAD domain-containing putative transcriptional regulator [Gaiellaceae bacterium]